jgi:glycosyltransferase involved in cell wall biosynthesis
MMQIILLSRLRIHGETLYKKLGKLYDVVWIGRRFPYSLNFINAPFLLFYEFLCLLRYHNIRIRSQTRIILVHFISLDCLVAFLFKKIFDYKVILYAIGSDVLGVRNAIQQNFLKRALSEADKVLCVNRIIENHVRSMGYKNTAILPTPFLEPNEKNYFGEKEYDIISVGALTPVKAHSLLIQSCRYLDRSTTIAIVGEGPLKSYLTNLARQYENHKILFLGFLPKEKLWIEYQKARVYVHTSIREGIPSSILEAMWFGLPIVSIKSSFTDDLTSLYKFKIFVVEKRSPYLLAMIIKKILENYENYKETANINKELLKDYTRHWDYELRLIVSSVRALE